MVPEPALIPGPWRGPVVWPPLADKPAVLPVVPREYHEFYRTARFRWWKPAAALGLFGGVWFVASLVFGFAAVFYDLTTGRIASLAEAGAAMTPALFAANNIALGLAIPLAALVGWAVFQQRPRWLSSITGRFRWPLLWRFGLVSAAVFLAGFGLGFVFGGVPELTWNPDSAFLIATIVLTTPFQAAGEEYAMRGLMARSIGSWFGSARAGLVVSTAVTAGVFTALHGAGDPWLNFYYFAVGVICSVLVWRTGGLEGAVALHVGNNLVSEITLPFTDLDSIFNRGAGVAGPEVLLQLVFTLAVMTLILWWARRLGVPRATAPGRPVW